MTGSRHRVARAARETRQRWDRRSQGVRQRAWISLVVLVGLLVYGRTLLPGMAFGDWGEMQTVPRVVGITHPTGYPSYVVLGWLVQMIPVGSVAFRANALSAVVVALALGATAAISITLGVRPVIAAGAALACGAVTAVWSAATAAEVNGLHLLLVAVLLHRALVWERRRAKRDLLIGGLVTGLAIGNHPLTLSVAPFIVAFVLWVGRRELLRRPQDLAGAAIALLVGVGVYLYIPLAAATSPRLGYNHPIALDGVWWLVSGAQFRDQLAFLTPAGPAELVRSLPDPRQLLRSWATLVGPAVGVVGIGLLVKRRMALGLVVVCLIVVNVYLWGSYLRLEHYLLLTWQLLAIGASVALEAVAGSLEDRSGSRAASRWESAGLLVIRSLAIVFAVALGAWNWGTADRSADRSAEAFVDSTLAALPQDAAILSQWDASTPLWHAQLVLGRRPDILVIDDTDVVFGGWGSREARIASLICRRPVFIIRVRDAELTTLRTTYRVTTVAQVRIGHRAPTASLTRPLQRIQPVDERSCTRSGA